MADTLTVGQEPEGRVLAAVRKSDAVAYETMKILADAVKPMTSVIRSVTPPLVYDFTGQLLDSQRKFAEDVLHFGGRALPDRARLTADIPEPQLRPLRQEPTGDIHLWLWFGAHGRPGPSSSRCASAVAQVALSGCRALRACGDVFVLFPELPFEDLAAGVLGHGVGDDDPLGCLVAR